MTTSVSSPSILLLGASSATATASDTNTAQPSGNAASGDFDLLLSTLADQHLLTLNTPITPQSTGEPAASASSDSGSVLPIGGIFLPLVAAPGTGEKNALAKTTAVKTEEADQHKNSSADKADDQSDNAITLWLNPATPIIPPAPTSASSAPATTTADDLVAELAALTSLGGKSAKTDKTAAVSSRADTGTTSVDAANNTSPMTDAKNITTVAGISDPTRSADETDFSALLKQIDNAAPASTNSGAAIAQWQDPRALANTNANASVNSNAATATATVAVPVGANGWSDAVTDKVMWFSANHINSAEIHLNPSDLGPVQVRISTQNDQTTVAFSSPHAAVREALDHALPRLRDMMGSQGIQLLDVSVGGQSAERQQYSRGNENFNNGATPSYFGDDNKTAEPIAVTAVNTARLSRSAVDAYV